MRQEQFKNRDRVTATKRNWAGGRDKKGKSGTYSIQTREEALKKEAELEAEGWE